MLSSFTLYLTSCEKAEIQKSSIVTQSIETRGDCDECPDNDQCCCFITLQPNEDYAEFIICASSSGVGTCFGQASGSCDAFSGTSYAITLTDPGTPKVDFCSLVSGPFVIINTSGTLPANVIISCQNYLTNPDTVWVQLPVSGRKFIQSNGDCELGPC
jgi:hypothetical protein